MNWLLKLKTKILSFLTTRINGVNLHNFAKFNQIYKIWFNIKLDSIKGDYIEFGIFKGKSLLHSVNVTKKLDIFNDKNFWGLDSFTGFPVENHDFYLSENFKSSKKKVEKPFIKYKNVHIVEGFFEDSVVSKELASVNNISFAFVDCDIYESAETAFKYIKKKISNGGFIMIDDFSSVDKNGNYIAKSFYEVFADRNILFFDSYSNGQTFRVME